MTFEEFQRKRALLSHNVLKNGIIMRLPEESVQFVLRTPLPEQQKSETPPEQPRSVNNNLKEAGRTWLEGVEDASSGVVNLLAELMDMIPQVNGFRKGSEYDERRRRVESAAAACTPIMVGLSEGSIDVTVGGWVDFLGNLKLIIQAVDEMRGGHSNLQKWMTSAPEDAPSA